MREHPSSHREAKATAPVLDSARHYTIRLGTRSKRQAKLFRVGEMTYCCPDLEKLIHPSEAGIGLIRVNKQKAVVSLSNAGKAGKPRLLRLAFKYNSALSAGISFLRVRARMLPEANEAHVQIRAPPTIRQSRTGSSRVI